MTNKRNKANLLSLIAFTAMLIFGSPVWAQQQSPAATTLTTAQLEQLVAPIALYPDDLLSQVLMASTYPLEVVEAARWSRDNPNVTGKALEDAMQKQAWDPSVKALTAVPQTLQMMNDQLKWTQDLGDAFLAQQTDVLDTVQRLRARADAAGNLKTTSQQTVRRVNRPANVSAASGAPATAYEIVPTTPDEYFVPIYDPTVVYGAWPYPDYLPFYWYPPGWGGWLVRIWRGRARRRSDLGRRQLVEPERERRSSTASTNSIEQTSRNRNWSHNAAHRRGVAYNNPQRSQRALAIRDAARHVIRPVRRWRQGRHGPRRHGTRRNGRNGPRRNGRQGGMGGGMAGGMGGMGQGGMGGMGQGGMGGMGQGGMAGGMGGMGRNGGMARHGWRRHGGHGRRRHDGGGGMGFSGGGGGGGMGFSGGGGGRSFSGGGGRQVSAAVVDAAVVAGAVAAAGDPTSN